MFVCVCKSVTDRQIRETAELGATTLDDLRDALGVGSCCGKCACAVAEILAERTKRPMMETKP